MKLIQQWNTVQKQIEDGVMNVVSRRCNIVYQNLDQYDMVYGPMCANVESVVNNHEDANVILEIMQHSNISTRKTMFSNIDMRYFVANTSSQSNSHFPSS